MVKIKDIILFLKRENICFSFAGDEETEVKGFSSLNHYIPESMTWIKKPENINRDPKEILLAVTQTEFDVSCRNTIYADDSKYVFFTIVEEFFAKTRELPDIGHGTYISDDVKIGNNVFIGVNSYIASAIVKNQIKIGEDALVGMGAVVTKDVPANTVVVGSPARVLRKRY